MLDWMEDASSAMIRRLTGLLDPALRTAVLSDHFAQSSPEAMLDLLGALVAGAEVRSTPHRNALLHACQALHQPSFDPLRRSIAQRAADRAQYAITEMFRVDEDSVGPIEQARDQQPLGSRKARARVARVADIPKLLRDPDPTVVQILLENPKLRLSDVLRVASRRPANRAHLEAIFRHPRWVCHYAVQSALAKNPNTPSSIAHCLLYQLRETDLREVAQAGGLEESLRSSAKALLQQPFATEREAN